MKEINIEKIHDELKLENSIEEKKKIFNKVYKDAVEASRRNEKIIIIFFNYKIELPNNSETIDYWACLESILLHEKYEELSKICNLKDFITLQKINQSEFPEKCRNFLSLINEA